MLFTRCYGNKKHPAVIFFHGFLGSSLDFHTIINSLKQRYFCIAFDLPGHGLSPMNPSLSFETFPSLLQKHIAKYNLENMSLVGYSLGGRLILSLEKQYPSFFKKCVLISAHYGLDNSKDKLIREKSDKNWIKILEKEGLYKFLIKWYGQPIFTTLCSNSGKLQKMIQRRCDQNSEALPHYLNYLSLAKQKNYKNHLLKNSHKYRFISGQDDKKFTQLYKDLGLEHEIVPYASHAPHLEQPLEIARIIETYLS